MSSSRRPDRSLDRRALWAIGVGGVALLLSVSAHLAGFFTFAALLPPPVLPSPPQVRSSGPVEIAFAEFEVEGPLEPEPDQPEPEAQPEPARPEAQAPARPPPPPITPVVPPPAAPPPPPAEEARPQPPRPDPMNRQAVQQTSDNPEAQVENAQFIADENRLVEEETSARIRSHQEDSPETSPGQEQTATDLEDEGNANHEQVEDSRDREGSDARTATEREAQARRPEQASTEPPPNVVARGNTGREGGARGGDEAGASEQGGEISPFEVTDRETALALLVPAVEEGSGGGETGGARREGSGRGEAGTGQNSGRAGARRGEQGRGRGTGETGPDLRVSWRTLTEAVGEEQLRAEREQWVEERQSRIRGSNRGRDFRRFRAAIENYVPNVRPGNQTALNAAASPYAGYIAAVHRRIHRQYADRFIRGLPAGGLSPFADRSLQTKLEIIVNRDGTVHRIGVVRTSGYLMFDHGAFSAVMRAQPFPEAPSQILSGDGRVYIHWGFYRNERQCGTFNAEPFILPNPPGTPRRGQELLRDGMPGAPERGGVIPENAEPSWGTELPAPSPTEGENEEQLKR